MCSLVVKFPKRKKIIFIVVITSMIAFCCAKSCFSYGKSNTEETRNLPDSAFRTYNFISPGEAEKILKKPAHLLKDSLFKKRSDGNLRFQFTYKANAFDSITRLIPSLFFGFEQFQQPSEAIRFYKLAKVENEKICTLYDLNQTGDEGFWGTNQSFPFIFIRKDNKIFTLRVLYETSQESLNELLSVAKKIVSIY